MQRFAQRGAVVIEDDHLQPDNIFRFTMPLPSPIRILAVNGESDRIGMMMKVIGFAWH